MIYAVSYMQYAWMKPFVFKIAFVALTQSCDFFMNFYLSISIAPLQYPDVPVLAVKPIKEMLTLFNYGYIFGLTRPSFSHGVRLNTVY